MTAKKPSELIKECDNQLDALFTTLGKLLYENIQANAMSYYFDQPNDKRKVQAKKLIRDIVVEKISDKKPAPPAAAIPEVSPESPAIEMNSEPIPEDSSTPIAKPESSRKKNQIASIIRGAKNIFLKETPSSTLGIERRGQLDPYVQLIADLHVLKNKLIEIQTDLNECLTLGLLHTMNERTIAHQEDLNNKIQTINLLIQKKQEEIKRIMENKKHALRANPEKTSWKPEDEFLKKIGQEVTKTAGRIDELINEVVGLFNSIKDSYDKDLEEHRLSREKAQNAAPSLPISAVRDISSSVPVLQQTVKEEEEIELLLKNPIRAESSLPEFPNSGSEETSELNDEGSDYGLFETATRKLKSNLSDADEKLSILHTLFKNSPKTAVPFLYKFINEEEFTTKRQIISLLAFLDYPTLVDLYRLFITSEESSMRLQGIMGLVKLGSDEAKNVILSAVNDRDAHVRRFIVNHLEHTNAELDAAAIARLANDSDDNVARIAIRKLALMDNHFAFVTLVPKLEDLRIRIRKEVIDALKMMTGTDLGYHYAGSESERRDSIKKWKNFVSESYSRPRLLKELRAKNANQKNDSLPKPEHKTPPKTGQSKHGTRDKKHKS